MDRYFMPSEVARLILGYFKDEGCVRSYEVFLNECRHLEEYRSLLEQGHEYPKAVLGTTLCDILQEYGQIKKENQDTSVRKSGRASSCKSQNRYGHPRHTGSLSDINPTSPDRENNANVILTPTSLWDGDRGLDSSPSKQPLTSSSSYDEAQSSLLLQGNLSNACILNYVSGQSLKECSPADSPSHRPLSGSNAMVSAGYLESFDEDVRKTENVSYSVEKTSRLSRPTRAGKVAIRVRPSEVRNRLGRNAGQVAQRASDRDGSFSDERTDSDVENESIQFGKEQVSKHTRKGKASAKVRCQRSAQKSAGKPALRTYYLTDVRASSLVEPGSSAKKPLVRISINDLVQSVLGSQQLREQGNRSPVEIVSMAGGTRKTQTLSNSIQYNRNDAQATKRLLKTEAHAGLIPGQGSGNVGDIVIQNRIPKVSLVQSSVQKGGPVHSGVNVNNELAQNNYENAEVPCSIARAVQRIEGDASSSHTRAATAPGIVLSDSESICPDIARAHIVSTGSVDGSGLGKTTQASSRSGSPAKNVQGSPDPSISGTPKRKGQVKSRPAPVAGVSREAGNVSFSDEFAFVSPAEPNPMYDVLNKKKFGDNLDDKIWQLAEKMAGNINNKLSIQAPSDNGTLHTPPSGSPVHKADTESVSTAAVSGGADSNGSSTSNLFKHLNTALLEGTQDSHQMSQQDIEGIVDMTRNDPAFDALFSLFNVDKNEFIEREYGVAPLTADDMAPPTADDMAPPTADGMAPPTDDGMNDNTSQPQSSKNVTTEVLPHGDLKQERVEENPGQDSTFDHDTGAQSQASESADQNLKPAEQNVASSARIEQSAENRSESSGRNEDPPELSTNRPGSDSERDSPCSEVGFDAVQQDEHVEVARPLDTSQAESPDIQGYNTEPLEQQKDTDVNSRGGKCQASTVPIQKLNVQLLSSDEGSDSGNVIQCLHEGSDGRTENVENVRIIGLPTPIKSNEESLLNFMKKYTDTQSKEENDSQTTDDNKTTQTGSVTEEKRSFPMDNLRTVSASPSLKSPQSVASSDTQSDNASSGFPSPYVSQLIYKGMNSCGFVATETGPVCRAEEVDQGTDPVCRAEEVDQGTGPVGRAEEVDQGTGTVGRAEEVDLGTGPVCRAEEVDQGTGPVCRAEEVGQGTDPSLAQANEPKKEEEENSQNNEEVEKKEENGELSVCDISSQEGYSTPKSKRQRISIFGRSDRGGVSPKYTSTPTSHCRKTKAARKLSTGVTPGEEPDTPAASQERPSNTGVSITLLKGDAASGDPGNASPHPIPSQSATPTAPRDACSNSANLESNLSDKKIKDARRRNTHALKLFSDDPSTTCGSGTPPAAALVTRSITSQPPALPPLVKVIPSTPNQLPASRPILYNYVEKGVQKTMLLMPLNMVPLRGNAEKPGKDATPTVNSESLPQGAPQTSPNVTQPQGTNVLNTSEAGETKGVAGLSPKAKPTPACDTAGETSVASPSHVRTLFSPRRQKSAKKGRKSSESARKRKNKGSMGSMLANVSNKEDPDESPQVTDAAVREGNSAPSMPQDFSSFLKTPVKTPESDSNINLLYPNLTSEDLKASSGAYVELETSVTEAPAPEEDSQISVTSAMKTIIPAEETDYKMDIAETMLSLSYQPVITPVKMDAMLASAFPTPVKTLHNMDTHQCGTDSLPNVSTRAIQSSVISRSTKKKGKGKGKGKSSRGKILPDSMKSRAKRQPITVEQSDRTLRSSAGKDIGNVESAGKGGKVGGVEGVGNSVVGESKDDFSGENGEVSIVNNSQKLSTETTGNDDLETTGNGDTTDLIDFVMTRNGSKTVAENSSEKDSSVNGTRLNAAQSSVSKTKDDFLFKTPPPVSKTGPKWISPKGPIRNLKFATTTDTGKSCLHEMKNSVRADVDPIQSDIEKELETPPAVQSCSRVEAAEPELITKDCTQSGVKLATKEISENSEKTPEAREPDFSSKSQRQANVDQDFTKLKSIEDSSDLIVEESKVSSKKEKRVSISKQPLKLGSFQRAQVRKLLLSSDEKVLIDKHVTLKKRQKLSLTPVTSQMSPKGNKLPLNEKVHDSSRMNTVTVHSPTKLLSSRLSSSGGARKSPAVVKRISPLDSLLALSEQAFQELTNSQSPSITVESTDDDDRSMPPCSSDETTRPKQNGGGKVKPSVFPIFNRNLKCDRKSKSDGRKSKAYTAKTKSDEPIRGVATSKVSSSKRLKNANLMKSKKAVSGLDEDQHKIESDWLSDKQDKITTQPAKQKKGQTKTSLSNKQMKDGDAVHKPSSNRLDEAAMAESDSGEKSDSRKSVVGKKSDKRLAETSKKSDSRTPDICNKLDNRTLKADEKVTSRKHNKDAEIGDGKTKKWVMKSHREKQRENTVLRSVSDMTVKFGSEKEYSDTRDTAGKAGGEKVPQNKGEKTRKSTSYKYENGSTHCKDATGKATSRHDASSGSKSRSNKDTQSLGRDNASVSDTPSHGEHSSHSEEAHVRSDHVVRKKQDKKRKRGSLGTSPQGAEMTSKKRKGEEDLQH